MIQITFLDNIKGKLTHQKQALQIQKEIIDSIKDGTSLNEVIKDDKEIIVKWYCEGKCGKELYANFYNQLNKLAQEELILEDINTIMEVVRKSNHFFREMDNLIVFNDLKEIKSWYLKGRNGDKDFKKFYNVIKQHAFNEIIIHDENIILNLLNDGLDLESALNSSKILSTKEEFKNYKYGALEPIFEKHSQKSVVDGLKKGKLFTDLIESENIYNTSEEILNWYRQGREGNSQYRMFYEQALPFVVKQDYNKVSKAINNGFSIEKLITMPNLISSQKEMYDYSTDENNTYFETFIEQDTQKAILNSCLEGKSFKEAINNNFIKYNSKDIEIWYKLGRGGDSKYEKFFNDISPYVLKDDCKTILEDVKKGKSLNEAIETNDLLGQKKYIEQLYCEEEFISQEISDIVHETIETLILNTNFSSSNFDFNALDENVQQWVELGKLKIKPFNKFYDEYLIYKTQAAVIDSVENNELFDNAISQPGLSYNQNEILNWFFMGKKGEKYIEFYKACEKYAIAETKHGIIEHLIMYRSFNQAIRQYNSWYDEDEIREWFNRGKSGGEHAQFYQDCMQILNQLDDSIKSLDDFLTPKYEERLKLANFTIEDYDAIIDEIYQIGNSTIKFNDEDTTFDKISKVVNAYASWSYKSRGGELGFYRSNFIKLDDRLLESQKISTLIHELTHHLVAEILELVMCYILDVEKTQAIEGFIAFFLIDPLSKIMNEFCASTVEGRFIPHGFQNYGAFHMAMDESTAEEPIKELYTYIGNTFADDIINILENFIDIDLREEIKTQFKSDMFPPNYEEIRFECSQTLPKDVIINLLSEALVDYYNLAKNSDKHKQILDIAYKDFDSCYQ